MVLSLLNSLYNLYLRHLSSDTPKMPPTPFFSESSVINIEIYLVKTLLYYIFEV